MFSYSHKRTNAVNTLASTRAITVDKERGIDSALLFKRFLMVSQSGDLCLEEVMKYELSPYPPSLFEGKNLLRKPDKAPLQHAVRSHVNSSNDAILKVIPKTDHYVLDRGSLIHRLKWTDGSIYNSILSQSTCTAMPPWSLMAMMVAPVRRTMRINVEHEPRLQTKLTYHMQPKYRRKKG